MEPELKLLEPVELEFELEPEDAEPDEPEPDELEFEFDDPVLDVPDEPVLAEDPVEDEPDDEEDVLVLWVEPGRARATTPATATLANVTVVVVERTLARPRSLAAIARAIPSRCALLM